MTDFTITEDFPQNEIEFDARFSDANACYDYLFKHKWPGGFVCKKCDGTKNQGPEGAVTMGKPSLPSLWKGET